MRWKETRDRKRQRNGKKQKDEKRQEMIRIRQKDGKRQ